MQIECYAGSRPQEGRSSNEDAFRIGRSDPPYAALADGAGNAERAAKRVLALFEKLYAEAKPEDIAKTETWEKWMRLLNSSLQGGPQSTFLAVAAVEGVAVGVCVGDSRAYLVNRDGECLTLTENAGKARLGSGRTEPFSISRRLTPSDIVLLLSDGAWTPLGSYLLKKAVAGARGKHFSEMPGAVLDAASRTGRSDDMTTVAIRLLR